MMEFLMLIGMSLLITLVALFGIYCGIIVGKGITEILLGRD